MSNTSDQKPFEKAPRKMRIVIPVAEREDKSTYTVEALYKEYYKFLLRRFTSITGTKEDGEDLTQETFERLIKYWDRVQLDKIEGALAVIAHNVHYDWMGRKFNRPQTIAVDDILEYDCHDNGISNPYRVLVNDRGFEKVFEVTSSLNELQYKVFNMYFGEMKDVSEIAEELGLRNSIIYTALNSIKKVVNDLAHKPCPLEVEHE